MILRSSTAFASRGTPFVGASATRPPPLPSSGAATPPRAPSSGIVGPPCPDGAVTLVVTSGGRTRIRRYLHVDLSENIAD